MDAQRLVYAGEDGTTVHANKETRWGNLAPRLGVAWDVTGDAVNVLRAGYGRSFFPVPYAAGNLLHQNVPNQVSQNYSVETNPLVYTPDRVPRLSNPFPASCRCKPRTTAELNAANPLVFGHAFSNETPHMDTWQVSYERQLTNTLMAEIAYVGSKGANLDLGRQHQRGAAGPGLAGLAPADPAAVERGDDQLLRSHQQLELQQPAGEAQQALLGRAAVPRRATPSASRSTTRARRPPAAARWAARRA